MNSQHEVWRAYVACHERGHWRAIAAAATSITLANLAVLLWATRHGWLAGTAFPRPWGTHLITYGLLNLLFVMAPLAMYHRVSRVSEGWAQVTYLALVAAFSLASIPVLQVFLARGIFVFGGGYSVAWDVTWGATQYLVALILYRWIVSIRRKS